MGKIGRGASKTKDPRLSAGNAPQLRFIQTCLKYNEQGHHCAERSIFAFQRDIIPENCAQGSASASFGASTAANPIPNEIWSGTNCNIKASTPVHQ